MTDAPAYYTAQINMSHNDDWIVPFVYQMVDVNANVTGPIDLTGSVFKMQIRRVEEEHEAIVTVFSPDGGITIDDALNGLFTIRIVRAMMVRLPPGDYVSDLVRLMANGYQERLFSADVVVVLGTSR